MKSRSIFYRIFSIMFRNSRNSILQTINMDFIIITYLQSVYYLSLTNSPPASVPTLM
jgi:hypothetical protein